MKVAWKKYILRFLIEDIQFIIITTIDDGDAELNFESVTITGSRTDHVQF